MDITNHSGNMFHGVRNHAFYYSAQSTTTNELFSELSPFLPYFSGSAEILGSLGLILPGITKIQTRLTPLAGLGLALLMIGAAGYHIIRGEMQSLPTNIVLFAISAYIAYGRWNNHPLPDSKT